MDAEVFGELAGRVEIFDLLSAKVLRHLCKLVFCDLYVNFLRNFDAVFGLLVDCPVLCLLVQDMVQQVVDVILLILVLCKFLGQLARHCHFLTL